MTCILSLKVKLLTKDLKVKHTKISPKRKPELILQKLCIPVKDQILDVLAGKNN